MKIVTATYAYLELKRYRKTETDWSKLAEKALHLYGQYLNIPDNELNSDYVKYMIILDALGRGYIEEQLEELDLY